MVFQLPEKPTVDYSANGADDANVLRRRLLGAAVLIALAVIFLPLLLDGSGTESRFRRVEQLRVEPPRIIEPSGQIEVPEKTAITAAASAESATQPTSITPPAKVQETPVQATEIQATERQETKADNTLPLPTQPTAAATATASTREPVATPTPANPSSPSDAQVQNLVAWVVQAGSFSSEPNAITLRDRLREAGFPAFVSTAETDSSLFRVKVGPITDQQKASAVQAEVQQLLGYETLIRQYR